MEDDNFRCEYIFQDGSYLLERQLWPTKFVTRPMIGETVISQDGVRTRIMDIRYMQNPKTLEPLMEIVLGQPYLT